MHYPAIGAVITKHAFSELFVPSLSEIIPLSVSLSSEERITVSLPPDTLDTERESERIREFSELNDKFYNCSTLKMCYVCTI